MRDRVSDTLLAEFSDFVAARTALHFPRERWYDLEPKAHAAAAAFGHADTGAFIHWLAAGAATREQVGLLVSHLTVNETYFWREPDAFAALEGHILPELMLARQGDRRLRIWSVGCSTGEEAYSIAIALCRVIPAIQDWSITLLATDINPRVLRLAAAGVYCDWSLRNTPPWLRASAAGSTPRSPFSRRGAASGPIAPRTCWRPPPRRSARHAPAIAATARGTSRSR